MMLFVLGQSSDRKAILRNLHEKHHPFPARRPLGAKEDQDRGSRECFFHSVSPRIAKRSCGIYSKANEIIHIVDRKQIFEPFTWNLLKSTILSLEGVLADAKENFFVQDHGDASVYRAR